MEDLWKDMSLASTPVALQYYSPAAASYRDRAAYLNQDYLQPPRTPPPPHAALSLEFTYLGSSGVGSGRAEGPPSNSTSSGDDTLHLPVDPFAFSFPRSNTSNTSSRRVAPVQAPAAGSGDRRQRRMIKNRESAARSRARKQAYTNELELELAQLRRENIMLIKREQDLHARLAMAAQAPDRSTLQRCRSAPAP
uniref:Uncharacterized protein n=1 Tax=Avena sativa TaxID=4498 RepID=A0ACD5UFM8_AVESA